MKSVTGWLMFLSWSWWRMVEKVSYKMLFTFEKYHAVNVARVSRLNSLNRSFRRKCCAFLGAIGLEAHRRTLPPYWLNLKRTIYFNRFITLLALMVTVSASAFAVDINVASISFPNFRYGGTTAKIRIYNPQGFIASDGTPIVAGRVGSKQWTQEVQCSVNGATLSCPSFVIKSTTDALDNANSRYTAIFVDAKGIERDIFLSDFAVPTTLGSSVTFAQIKLYNAARQPVRDVSTYTKEQTNAQIQQQIGNIVSPSASASTRGLSRLSVAPIAAADPVALAANDPTVVTCLATKGCFDINSPPYNAIPDDGTDDTVAFNSAIADAVAYGFAHNGSSVVVTGDSGVYNINGSLQQTSRHNAQIIIPDAGLNDEGAHPMLDIRSKNLSPSARPYGTTRHGGNMILQSNLTGKSYSTTYGLPCIMAAPDKIRQSGFGDHTRVNVRLLGLSFVAPPNPSVCGFNGQMLDSLIIEDSSAYTTDPYIGGDLQTQPTNPTGIAFLMPLEFFNGGSYRGYNEVTGWYGAFGMSELVTNTGELYSIQNKVALPVLAAWSHASHLAGPVYSVRDPYGVAFINPATGISAVANGLAGLGLSHINFGMLDFEDFTGGGWRNRVSHINDPTNQLRVSGNYFRVVNGFGPQNGLLTFSGGCRNCEGLRDLGKPPPATTLSTLNVIDTFTGADGTALTAHNPDQLRTGNGWNVVPTFGGFNLFHNGAIGITTGYNAAISDGGASNGTITAIVKFPTLGTAAAGIIFRYTDQNNYWYAELFSSSGVLTLYKKVAGVTTSVASNGFSVAANQYVTIRVNLTDTAIQVLFNGTVMYSITDSFNAASGGHGIITSGTTSIVDEYNFRP